MLKTALKTGALVSVEKELLYEPFLIEETAPILQKAKKALRRLGLTARVEAGGGGMDANIFNAKGLTSLGIATGYSKNHTLEENLDELSFIKSGRLVELLIEDS